MLAPRTAAGATAGANIPGPAPTLDARMKSILDRS